jgi:S1-C subfamily serine protease
MDTSHPHHIPPRIIVEIVAISLLFILGCIGAIVFITAQVSNSYEQSRRSNTVTSDGSIVTFSLPESTSYVPNTLDSSTLVAIAKNQPAVVRIVTVYCADVTLSSRYGTFALPDSCSGGVGSGSFISSDGYIATNGHVVSVTPKQALIASVVEQDKINDYLDYLLKSKLLPSAQAKALVDGLNSGDSGAIDALTATIDAVPIDSVSASRPEVQYAVQISNEPVRVDRTGRRISVNLTDSVIAATLVDQNFDANVADSELASGSFTSSDVALLKATGSFPYVDLGAIESVAPGSQLTAIGFPAFIDGSVDTTQWQTVPSITQGKVQSVQTDADINGRNILTTSVPIAQGNSGGPAFNDQGKQIGINTYSDIQCPDLQCFGDGLVRDIADLQALIVKNNITLKKGGVTEEWHRAIDAYRMGDYQAALASFSVVQTDYPANYLVATYARDARTHVANQSIGSLYQRSSVTTIVSIIIAVLSCVVIAAAAILVVYYAHRRRQFAKRRRSESTPKTPL